MKKLLSATAAKTTTVKACLALSCGIGIMAVAVMALFALVPPLAPPADAPQPLPARMAEAHAVTFPENETALRRVAEDLISGIALHDISPAAGTDAENGNENDSAYLLNN